MQIILDISANTTKNDNKYLKRMLDELKKVDTGKHDIVIKGQLFKEAGDNIVMTHDHFDYMYNYANKLGYKCTASVFDKESLDFLLTYDIPFVKIANNKDLYWLVGEAPRKYKTYISVGLDIHKISGLHNDYYLSCVSKYPAKIEDYDIKYDYKSISDHTQNTELFKSREWDIFEMHYALDGSSGLDVESGVCKTPKMLKEIL